MAKDDRVERIVYSEPIHVYTEAFVQGHSYSWPYNPDLNLEYS